MTAHITAADLPAVALVAITIGVWLAGFLMRGLINRKK